MSFPNYTTADTSDGTLDIALLSKQIESDPGLSDDSLFSGINRSDDDFTLLFDSTPSPGDQSQCDAIVAAHSGLPTFKDGLVSELKEHRSRRLESYIKAEYPAGSGNLFSCSQKSQGEWTKLVSMQMQGLVVYPFRVYTFDERGSYDLADADDLTGAIASVSAAVLAERSLAQGYIDSALAAADESAATEAAAPYKSLPV
jgi:hypothetical protein